MQIHKGEVIGLAGLLGSGRTETAEMMFGLKEVTGGSLKINGKEEKLSNPMAAMKEKIAFVRRIGSCPVLLEILLYGKISFGLAGYGWYVYAYSL